MFNTMCICQKFPFPYHKSTAWQKKASANALRIFNIIKKLYRIQKKRTDWPIGRTEYLKRLHPAWSNTRYRVQYMPSCTCVLSLFLPRERIVRSSMGAVHLDKCRTYKHHDIHIWILNKNWTFTGKVPICNRYRHVNYACLICKHGFRPFS